MKQEIERKFLVEPKKLPALSRPQNIIQGYLSIEPEIRIRVAGRKAFLTIKTAGELNRKEFEYKIPRSDAKKLLELTNFKIEKVRYFLNLNTSRWVIDFFQGVNYPLVTAEIELPSEDFIFDKPLWIQKEVTLNHRFRSSYLSQHPFSSWKQ